MSWISDIALNGRAYRPALRCRSQPGPPSSRPESRLCLYACERIMGYVARTTQQIWMPGACFDAFALHGIGMAQIGMLPSGQRHTSEDAKTVPTLAESGCLGTKMAGIRHKGGHGQPPWHDGSSSIMPPPAQPHHLVGLASAGSTVSGTILFLFNHHRLLFPIPGCVASSAG